MTARHFLILLISATADAQDFLDPVAPVEAETPQVEGALDALVVQATAPPAETGLAAFSLQPVSVIPAETLRRNAAASLGETLGWEPGVSSNYFGPGASRPVIRGFDGFRVRTLRDGLGTFDLSDISPDHGVALEPFLLESVEIHRGPASLLYGNAAIGGAVNARSRVLARELPGRPLSGGWEARYETNGDSPAAAGHLSVERGPIVLQATLSARESGDIRIPGRARSSAYEALENPMVFDPSLGASFPVPNPSGRLPNSAHESVTWSAGLSWLPEEVPLLLGVSYSRFDSEYGVPYIFPGDATDLFGDSSLDLQQDRVDLEGSLEMEGRFISKVELRLAWADYQHSENFTGRGKDLGRDFTDSRFMKEAYEGRIDVHHQTFDGRLTGIAGITGLSERLAAVRTVVPPPDLFRIPGLLKMENFGLHAVEKFQTGDWTFQLGHRVEHVDVTDASLASIGYRPRERGYSFSTSGGIGWQREGIGNWDRLGVSGTVSLTDRQPTAIERYAFWNNAGIGRFVVGGDLDGTPLDAEKSRGFDLGVEAARGPVTLRLNGFHYDFDHYIFLQEDPALTGGFGRAAQYIGRSAAFTGFEGEIEWRIREPLTLTLMTDYVHGRNRDDREPIPRMPPLRIGGRLEWRKGPVTVGLEVRHAFAQDRVKPAPRQELEAEDYTLVNLDAAWDLPVPGKNLTFFLRGTNLLDEEARPSTSFRKDVAPLPGIGLALGLRQSF